jgi:hypothetical protein
MANLDEDLALSPGSAFYIASTSKQFTAASVRAFMGYRTELLRFPEQRVSVICLCNLSRMNPSALAKKVADVYLAAEFPPTVAAADAHREFPVELAAGTLDALAGVYRNVESGQVVPVTAMGGRLTATAFGLPFGLAAVDARHFRSVSGPVPVYRFRVAGDSLTVALPNERPLTLRPTVRDAFAAVGAALTFVRDKQGHLTSAVLWAAQARNIRLERSSGR